jgi:ATP-binding cassette subfamily C protein
VERPRCDFKATICGSAQRKWPHEAATGEYVKSHNLLGGTKQITKAFRLFLQSAMLGLGAYLVLQNEVTLGVMIAGSILLGRGLAPIELMIG